MIDTQPNPPRLAHVLLVMLVRPSDSESIPGDLLEEYRDVRRPALGRFRADLWYVKHVLSVLWSLIRPCAVAMVALRIVAFPFPAGWNPSLVPAPGVSVIDALILVWAGYYGAHRTGRISTGIVTAGATSIVGVTTFFAYASIAFPSLLRAPFEKPFILAITSVVLLIAVGFGLAVGGVGAAAGRWLRPAPPNPRLT